MSASGPLGPLVMHFERQNAFQMHKTIFFSRKIEFFFFVCLPYLNLSDLLPETHLFFHLA